MAERTKTNTAGKEYMCIGLLAHVDAGKTTLSEAILHRTGAIRRAGRVDHGDAFLDTDAMERDRGITIFSKQASFTTFPDKETERVWTLVDTPGHADFSTEMERVLQVLDCAVLIISAADGVTGQVRILWRLLEHYGVPAFIFVNKMDQPGADRAAVYAQIRQELGSACVDLQEFAAALTDESMVSFGAVSSTGTLQSSGAEKSSSAAKSTAAAKPSSVVPSSGTGKSSAVGGEKRSVCFSPQLQEELAVCDEGLMERFFEGEEITPADAAKLAGERKLFPVCFGSALREEGVDGLLALLDALAAEPVRGQEFGARVYKITHDASGARLTWMKVTGGKLLPRQVIPESTDEKGQPQKASRIRYYRGERFEELSGAPAGIIVAVPGLSSTRAGMGLGAEADTAQAEHLLQPVMQSRLLLPPDQDLYQAYRKLRALEEEDPMLHLSYDEEKKELTVQVMGQVQREILQRLIEERFGMRVGFGPSRIIYRETIAEAVEGVGHFEPLRHYAEVHLLLEPGEPGSGLTFESRCSVNDLALNWQRLIMTHLMERRHRGVLTGAEITDIRISILGGRAHAKHTEGGDFRKATYRAVRQGLMMAQSMGNAVLLEPAFDFVLELPQENIGRAMADLQQRGASFGQPEILQGTERGFAAAGSAVTAEASGSSGTSGMAGNSRVSGAAGAPGNSRISGAAGAPGNSRVSGAAGMSGNTSAAGNTNISGKTGTAGNTGLTGNARAAASAGMARLSGTVTVAALGNYVEEVAAYTRGAGYLQCTLKGYVPCKNAEEVIAAAAYDPELDVRNPSSSVFCSHGAGTIIPWYQVRSFMHVDTGWRFPDEAPAMTEEEALDLAAERARKEALEREKQNAQNEQNAQGNAKGDDAFKRRQRAALAAEKELMEIFERTYGPLKPRAGAASSLSDDPDFSGTWGERPGTGSGAKRKKAKNTDPWGLETGRARAGGRASAQDRTDGGSGDDETPGTAAGTEAGPVSGTNTGRGRKLQAPQEHYLLVDGYNIIFAWQDLRELALSDIKSARDRLMDILSNFAGYRPEKVILVFDAYKVPGGRGEVMRWHNIDVVFTKEAETADLYIEKTAHVLSKKYRVTVATSDAVEQVIIFGAGAYRMSARMLLEEILFAGAEMRERYGIGTDE